MKIGVHSHANGREGAETSLVAYFWYRKIKIDAVIIMIEVRSVLRPLAKNFDIN